MAESTEEVSRDTVVLVLRNLTLDNKVPNGRGGYYLTGPNLLHYYDDHLIRHNVTKSSDTIYEVIPIKRSHLEVLFTYKGIDKLSFIFQNGDSILIQSAGNGLHLKALNRKVKKHDLDYELVKRNVLFKAYPTTAKSMLPAPFIYHNDRNGENGVISPLSPAEFQSKLQEYWRILLADNQEEKSRERRFLDSLYASDYLSGDVYEFYKQKNDFLDNELLFFKPDSVPRTFGDDSLIYFSFFQNYVEKLADKKWSSPFVSKRNAYLPDHRRQYDSLRITQTLESRTRDFLLTQALESIVAGFRSKYSAEYFSKYQGDVNDKKLVDYIAEKYNINKLTYLNEPLMLEDPSGRLHNFDTIIVQNKSKVIYIDFWASWCRPCLKEIPSLKSLKQLYKQDDDIVVIHISRDENRSAWLKSIAKNDIADNSFLIDNLYSARFLSEINFEEIPRYLLYNRDGDIVQLHAPSPSQLVKSEVLRKYLK